MIGAGITIRPNSRVAVIGDSISYGFAATSLGSALARNINAVYTAARPGRAIPGVLPDNASLPAGVGPGVPTWFIAAQAAYTVVDANIVLTPAVARFKPDVVIVELETNDAFNLVPFSYYDSAVLGLVDSLLGQCPNLTAAQILWSQAICIFEQLPFGTNPKDTVPLGLLAKDDTLRARAAAQGFNVWESRTNAAGAGSWTNYETINNPTNLDRGILMSDGIHPITYPSQRGTDYFVTQLRTAITVAGVG